MDRPRRGQGCEGETTSKKLDRDEEIEFFENEIKKMREKDQDPQRIVGEGELEAHLADGWQFVSTLFTVIGKNVARASFNSVALAMTRAKNACSF